MNILFTAPVDFNKELKENLKNYKVKFVIKFREKIRKTIGNHEVLITNPGSTYKYDKGLLKKARKLRYIITLNWN